VNQLPDVLPQLPEQLQKFAVLALDISAGKKPSPGEASQAVECAAAIAKVWGEINHQYPDPKAQGFIDGADFLRDFQPPDYQLEPLLVRSQVISLTAQPGGAKTTFAMLLVLLAIDLLRVNGLTATPSTGRAVMLLGENELNAAGQLYATLQAHGSSPKALTDRLWVLPRRDSLLAVADDVRQLALQVGGLDIVMVDSKAAFSAAVDENSNTEAGNDAAMLRELTRVKGKPTVLVLCHPAKGASGEGLSPRGGSAFLAEIDGNFSLEKVDGLVELKGTKLRQPPFEPMQFRIEQVELPVRDKRGRPVVSVCARPAGRDDAEQMVEAQRSDEDRLLTLMALNPGGTIREWMETAGWKNTSKVMRTLKSLEKDKLVENRRRRWRLTEHGKKEVA
jgi:hypothetical protein